MAEASGIPLGSIGQPVGVLGKTGQKLWIVTATVLVGGIELHNFPIRILDEGPWPSSILLGNNFFAGYRIEKDQRAGMVVCRLGTHEQTGESASNQTKSETLTSHYGGLLIPFTTKKSNQVLVSCKLNGRVVEMLFDTGATPGVNVTWQQIDKLSIPINFSSAARGGIGSTKIPYSVTSFDLDIGSFHAEGVNGRITDANQITWGGDYPLLGPDVFESQGYSWNIDRSHSVIVVEKKN